MGHARVQHWRSHAITRRPPNPAAATDPGYDRDFAYDDLNRLVTANTGMHLWRTGSYSYDAMGNMTSLRLGEVLDDAPDDLLRLRPKADVETRPLGRVTTFSYQGTTPKLDLVSTNDLERPVTYDAAGNELSYAVSRDYTARNLLGAAMHVSNGPAVRRVPAMKRFTAFVAVTLLLSTVACNGFVGEARITTAGASDAKATTTQAAAEQKKSTDQPRGTPSGDAGRSQRR